MGTLRKILGRSNRRNSSLIGQHPRQAFSRLPSSILASKIDTDGNFDGFAWGENIGWINFNDADLFGYEIMACKVNFIDLGNFVDDWLASGPALPGDLSGNEEVDFVDYGMFAELWLTYCPDDWPLK